MHCRHRRSRLNSRSSLLEIFPAAAISTSLYKNLALNTQQFYCWDEKDNPDEVRMRICYNTGHEPIEKKQT